MTTEAPVQARLGAGAATPRAPGQVLALVYLVYTVMALDKTMIAVLGEPLREHFRLSDGQFGLLIGFAYAIPFAVAGFPLGRLVDRRSRKAILASVLTAWSALTALTATAQSYLMLLVFRGGVGAAESGGPPAMLSIITDTFDLRRRPGAIGIYYTAAPFGAMLAALTGGRIAAAYGWQAPLLAAAAPGLVLAVVVALWLREPPRGRFEGASTLAEPTVSWRSALPVLGRHRRAMLTLAAIAAGSAVGFSVSYWITPLMMRTYKIPIAEAALQGLFVMSFASALGSLAGGVFAGRYMPTRHDAQLRLSALAIGGAFVCALAALFAPTPTLAMAGFAAFGFLNAVTFGPSFNVCLSSAPLAIRGTVAALAVMLGNLLGGLGPLAVGLLSDGFKAQGYENPLRLSVALLSLAGVVSVGFFLWAARANVTRG